MRFESGKWPGQAKALPGSRADARALIWFADGLTIGIIPIYRAVTQATDPPLSRGMEIGSDKTPARPDRGANSAHLPASCCPGHSRLLGCAITPPRRANWQTGSHDPASGGKLLNSPLCIPLAQLRGLPADPSHRVGVAGYQLFPYANPNGSPRPERIVSHACLTLGRDFRVQARILSQPSGMALELSPDGFDMTRRLPELFAFSPALVRNIYDALSQAHTLAKARQHCQSREGRN